MVKAKTDLTTDAPIMTLLGKCTAPPKYLPAVSQTLKSKFMKIKYHDFLSESLMSHLSTKSNWDYKNTLGNTRKVKVNTHQRASKILLASMKLSFNCLRYWPRVSSSFFLALTNFSCYSVTESESVY